MERSLVSYGMTTIDYVVRRSERRATVSIAIDPEEGVLVTAPVRATVDRLDRIVHAKAGWIVERLRRAQRQVQRPRARAFVSGETYPYLGRQHRLRVEVGGEERVRLHHGRLVVGVDRGSDDVQRAAYVRKALIEWYRDHAKARLGALVHEWAPAVGFSAVRVLVRDQHRRWGSCDAAGVIRLNWRIIQAPIALVEYVVAHELVHLRHADHTRAFWAALGRVMPEYERRRTELRRVGATFEW